MKEKRNFKQEFKDWWNENKKVVKTGGLCLIIGAFYGFAKGVDSGTKFTGKLIDRIPYQNNDDDEGSVYDETNVDDPELLELIRIENEEK